MNPTWPGAVEPQPVLPPGAVTVREAIVGGAVRHLAHSRRVLALAGELAAAFRADLVDVRHYLLSVRNAAAWAALESAHEVLTISLRAGIAAGYRGHGAVIDRAVTAAYPMVDRVARRWAERS